MASFLALVAVGLLVWFVAKALRGQNQESTDLRQEVLQLREQLIWLTRRVWELEQAVKNGVAPVRAETVTATQLATEPPTEEVPAAEPEVAAAAPVVEPEPEQEPEPEPELAYSLAADPGEFVGREESPLPPLPPSPPTSASWEQRLGENWLLKLGAVLLVIGIALLPTYSFGLLGPVGRVLLASGLSAVFLLGGLIVENRFPDFRRWAWGVMAIGWAGLYFTAFATYAIEATRIVPSPTAALLLMLAVVAGMVLHSLRYGEERITALPFFLAYMAFLIHREVEVVLPALALLAVAVLVLGWRNHWRWLVLGDVAFTYLAYAFLPGRPWVIPGFGDPLLWGLWLAFEGYDWLSLNAGRRNPYLLHANLLGFAAASLLGPVPSPAHFDGWLAWAAGAFALSAILRWRLAKDLAPATLEDELASSGPSASLIAMAVVLFFAIDRRFQGLQRGFGFLLEGELLFLAGWRAGNRILRGLGTIVLTIFLLRFAVEDVPQHRDNTGLFGWPGWTPLGFAAWASLLVNRGILGLGSKLGLAYGIAASVLWVALVEAIVPAAWRALVYAGFGALLVRFAPRDFRWQGLLTALIGIASFLAKSLDARQMPQVWLQGFALAGIFWWLARQQWASDPWLAVGVREACLWLAALVPLAPLALQWEGKYLALSWTVWAIALGAPLVAMPWQRLGIAYLATLAWLVVPPSVGDHALWVASGVLLTSLHWWLAETLPPTRYTDGFFGHLGRTVAAGLPLFLLAKEVSRPWIPLVWLVWAFVLLAVVPLQSRAQGFVIGWLATLAYLGINLDSKNPQWVGLTLRSLVLLPLLLFHWLAGSRAALQPVARTSQVTFAVLIAALLSQEFHREWISIAWGAAGAAVLVAGFLASQRWVRLAGLSLFGLGVLKLFLYDLSSLTGLARIMSFLVLGLLLIGASLAYTRYKERLTRLL